MPSDTETFKDPAKRAAIVDAAIQVFSTRGYPDTDVQLIADAAGVGKGTVYRYFGTKKDLFLTAADVGMRRLEEVLLARFEEAQEPLERVRTAGLAYAEYFQEHPELVEILIQERATFRGEIPDTHLFYREKNRGAFERLLRDGVAAGVFQVSDVRQATSAYANLLYGTVVCACLGGDREGIVEAARHAIDLFMRGIVADPAPAPRRELR